MIVHVPINISEGASPSEMQAIAKAVHEYGKKLVAAGKTSPNVKGPKVQKSGSALGAGDDEAQAVAGRLAKMLDSVSAKKPDDATSQQIFQQIISYRKLARQLPDETRANLDRKIAAYSNGKVKPKPAKRI